MNLEVLRAYVLSHKKDDLGFYTYCDLCRERKQGLNRYPGVENKEPSQEELENRPNFDEMSMEEHRDYLLTHRWNMEALDAYKKRYRRHGP